MRNFKIFLSSIFAFNLLFASDELSIVSLFKKQIGLRSITNLLLLSTGNANSYYFYLNITVSGDPTIWNDTKQLSLNQSFVSILHSKFDILISGGGSYIRQEYTYFYTNDYSSENSFKFDSLWLGFIYTFDSVADFIPRLTF